MLQRLTGAAGKNHKPAAGDGSIGKEQWDDDAPRAALADTDRIRLSNGHRRESSILSLSNGVKDLRSDVRRSVSLRSHRSQQSTSTLGHRPRYPSSGNLLGKGSGPEPSPTESVQSEPTQEVAPLAAQPYQRARGKLSISARSLSQRFRSTEKLPQIQPTPDLPRGPETTPPLPTSAWDPPPTGHSMLVAPSLPRRAAPDRPAIAAHGSFVRDLPSSHGLAGGVPLSAVPSSHATAASAIPGGALNPKSIYQTILDTANKRMATIDYLRKVHEGDIFYFGTLHYTSAALHATVPSLQAHKLGRKATNYLALGYSLPLLLDMNSGTPLEYLKALTAVLSEFETYQSESVGGASSLSRARVGAMFKGIRSGRRASAATESISLDSTRAGLLNLPGHDGGGTSPVDGGAAQLHDFQHLLTPHLPFDPDFATVFATLCDTLIDVYANLLALLHGPENCSPAVGEAFAKADKALRKILVANVMRELEEGTRQGVKTEVAGLGRLVLGGLM